MTGLTRETITDGWDTTPRTNPVFDVIAAQEAGVERAGRHPMPDGYTAINPTNQG